MPYDHSNIVQGEIDYEYINQNLITNIYNKEKDETFDLEENEINKISINKYNNINIIKEDSENEEKKEEKEKKNDFENIRNNLEEEKLGSEGSTYKIIFTSLSQSLCAYIENYFIRSIKNSNIPLDILPIPQKTHESNDTH